MGPISKVIRMTKINDPFKIRVNVGANAFSGNPVKYNVRIDRQTIDLREVKGMKRYYPD
jgi:hypothetical protein